MLRLPLSRIGRLAAVLLGMTGCPAANPGPDYPRCGTNENALVTLVPGPGQAGFDEALAAAARRHDRQFHALNAFATGLTAEFSVLADDPTAREAVERFLAEHDGWDFEAAMGRSPTTVGTWHKSAGLYGGVGIAADAYRYGVLRDSGADCAEVEIARGQLLRSLEALDVAARIGGVPGVMARSLLRVDLPTSESREVTPLFDAAGQPLPAEKNNGTWRADQTGHYGQYIWEDSLSRDMLVGWAMAFGAAFEVLGDDPGFPTELKRRLREDARAVGLALQKVGTSGYDLEIPDADGRLTFHAYLNENAIDRVYVAGAQNGFHALMALGIVGALARASGDEALDAWLTDELLGVRRLDRLADAYAHLVDMGNISNYSAYNMVFTGGFLAQQYVRDETPGRFIRRAIRDELYARPDNPKRQPKETKMTFFDLIYAWATVPEGEALAPQRAEAVAAGLETLREFPQAPAWGTPRINCDEEEIKSGTCTLDDGTIVQVLGEVGRNDALVADRPIPMRVRPRSNYYWRSNPYRPNDVGGESSALLLSTVDFRVAYWLGRWLRVE